MKLLWRIDILGFKLLGPIVERICKITGWSSEHLAHLFLDIGTFAIIGVLVTESVLQRGAWFLWYGWLTWIWIDNRRLLHASYKRLAEQWRTSDGMIPTEFFRLAPHRVMFILMTVFVIFLAAFTQSPALAVFAVSHLLLTLSMYAGSSPIDSGKKISERIKDVARNTAEKLRNLAPQPALQPVTVR